MTPAAKIVGLLADNLDRLTGVTAENLYAYQIDDQNYDTTNVILVVTEDSAGDHEFGNGDVISTIRRVSIQFYYPKDFDDDMAKIEKSVEAFLRTRRIRCYLDAGHVLTPDTQNITNTLKFNYLEMEE